MPHTAQRQCVLEALRALGITHVLFGIHDSAFPAAADEDPGRGTPYSSGAAGLLEQVAEWGFTGVQLGPQGETSRDNPSPYDGTAFSKNPLNASATWLVTQGLLPKARPAQLRSKEGGPPDRVQYQHAFAVVRAALEEAFLTLRQRPGTCATEVATFRARHAAWLVPDGLYGPLQALHGAWDFRDWANRLDVHLWTPRAGEEAAAERRKGELLRRFGEALERYAFVQWVVHAQHDELRKTLARLGLTLFGDLQIGLSAQDVWSRNTLFLSHYAMGAPPSRTNPQGQPWGYPVLDPDQYDGAVRSLMRARVGKMLDEFDGLRVDHPHGLVCPWVYRCGEPDPLREVQQGARLFDSPDLPDHPELARYAIAQGQQLDRSLPRHADGWVRWLSPEQLERYGRLFDTLVECVRERGGSEANLVCEVLSTQPLPLREVLARHHLGRFRVTQKADLDRPEDVYRSENARPEDWMMVGNHDTPPIWRVAKQWQQLGVAARHAEYLASRLLPDRAERPRWTRAFAENAALLAHAKLAELFASGAKNVMVFFTDVFGLEEPYNVPGTPAASNWSLRLPPDHRARYEEAVGAGRAFDLPWALAMALRARSHPDSALIRRLLELARSPHPFALTGA